MKDKEYHVANFTTFVSKTLNPPPPPGDEFNFKPAQYCINKIFDISTDQVLYLGGIKMVVIKL